MNPEVYREMAELQAAHWWFVARRRILAEFIGQLSLPPPADILEIGCGAGGNLSMLSAFGRVRAMESDDHARDIAIRLTGVPIVAGGLPEPVPFADGAFDLVCLLDVLEHIQDDRAALGRAGRLLKNGGRLLVTVPAYAWLWSAHDNAHHHQKRYTATMLRRCSREAGLEVRFLGYFNALLFPVIAAVRLVGKMAGATGESSDAVLPAPWLNNLLAGIFSFERHLLRHRLFPCGTSVLAVLTATPDTDFPTAH